MSRAVHSESRRSNRIRVCMTIRAFIPGGGTGVQRQLARLLPHLARRGVDANVLAGGTRGVPRRDHIDGVEIRRSALPGYSPPASGLFVAGSLTYVARRRDLLDLLHAHGAIHPGTVALGAHRLGIPAIIKLTRTGSKSDFVGLLGRRWGRLQAGRIIERCWFIAQSSQVKGELLSRGVAEERIFSIPNGVDQHTFTPPTREEKDELRARLGLGPEPVIISTSRLVSVKQLDIAVRAFGEVTDAQMLIVGDGDERPRLEGLSRRLGLGDRIRFVGKTNRVEDYLRAADIFVLPSSSEGMTNAFLEAMACGLACVTSPIVGGPEAFEGGAGLVVPSEEPRAWAESLSGLIGTPRAREKMGSLAAARVASEFTLEATADKTVAAYRTVLASGRR